VPPAPGSDPSPGHRAVCQRFAPVSPRPGVLPARGSGRGPGRVPTAPGCSGAANCSPALDSTAPAPPSDPPAAATTESGNFAQGIGSQCRMFPAQGQSRVGGVNDYFDPGEVGKALFDRWTERLEEVRMAVDGTHGGEFMMLEATLGVAGRGIPCFS
jgi:hypothetical protein